MRLLLGDTWQMKTMCVQKSAQNTMSDIFWLIGIIVWELENLCPETSDFLWICKSCMLALTFGN